MYEFNKDGYNKDGFNEEGFDKNGINKDGFNKYCYKKTNQARSFEDQKGKGYVNLPILLSKMYTNNSSKELKNNIKQLIKYLYDKKQITKQVYNNLNKAIMTRKEQIEILDNKIKVNKRQYDLDRINAETSAYSNGDLSKYE